MRATISVVLAFSLLSGCGFDAADDASDLSFQAVPIINGQPDTDPDHRAVIALFINNPFGWFCSGTMIAPNVVLTAAHCYSRYFRHDYEVLFGPNAQEAVHRKVTDIWVHPEYNGAFFGYADLCLMRFEGSVPDGIKPIPHLPAALELTQADEGSPLQFTGFGVTETGQFTTKLTVTTILTHVCGEALDCAGLGFINKPGLICYEQEDVGGPCSGDSGGPSFKIRDGQEYVVGVTSYGDRNCRFYGCSVKVDAYQEWIDAFIAAEGLQGEACTEDLACRSGHCTDGVCCDYACDQACEACDLPGNEGDCLPVTDGKLEPGCASGGGCAVTSANPARTPVGLLLGLGLLGLLGLGVCLRRRPVS